MNCIGNAMSQGDVCERCDRNMWAVLWDSPEVCLGQLRNNNCVEKNQKNSQVGPWAKHLSRINSFHHLTARFIAVLYIAADNEARWSFCNSVASFQACALYIVFQIF